MTSLADDLAALHHDDLVGTLDGAESMRDDEGRALVKNALDRPLDQCFTLGIHLAGGLVENQDWRSTKNRAGDADTLLLAARKLRAEAAQQRVISLRLFHDVIMGKRALGSLLHLLAQFFAG